MVIFLKAEHESVVRNTTNAEEESSLIMDESEDDVEIVEDENGQCTVRIKPKPIKLKIINPYATQNTVPTTKSTNNMKKRKLSTDDNSGTNGHLNDSNEFDHNVPTAKKPRMDSKEIFSSDSIESNPKAALGRPKTPTHRDIRTHCDKVFENYVTVIKYRSSYPIIGRMGGRDIY